MMTYIPPVFLDYVFIPNLPYTPSDNVEFMLTPAPDMKIVAKLSSTPKPSFTEFKDALPKFPEVVWYVDPNTHEFGCVGLAFSILDLLEDSATFHLAKHFIREKDSKRREKDKEHELLTANGESVVRDESHVHYNRMLGILHRACQESFISRKPTCVELESDIYGVVEKALSTAPFVTDASRPRILYTSFDEIPFVQHEYIGRDIHIMYGPIQGN